MTEHLLLCVYLYTTEITLKLRILVQIVFSEKSHAHTLANYVCKSRIRSHKDHALLQCCHLITA